MHLAGSQHTMGESVNPLEQDRGTQNKSYERKGFRAASFLPPNYSVQLLLLPLAFSTIGFGSMKCEKLP